MIWPFFANFEYVVEELLTHRMDVKLRQSIHGKFLLKQFKFGANVNFLFRHFFKLLQIFAIFKFLHYYYAVQQTHCQKRHIKAPFY